MKLFFKKIVQYGFNNFKRNSLLSFATISIFTLTLFVLFSLLSFSVLTTALVDILKDKVDVSVYFQIDAPEERILKIKESLFSLSDIKEIEYISREEALFRFKERHQDNDVIIQALKELGTNPLQPALNIKTLNLSSYKVMSDFLSREEFSDIIEKVNYTENKQMIDKIESIISAVRKTGFGITLFLGIIAVLVTFNTIRLAIYSSREEIGIMRLVGASNWYIRGPFIFEGVLYGAISSILTIMITYPVLVYVSPKISNFTQLNMLEYFNANFWNFFLILIGTGIALGVIGSFIAIRRYLKV